MTTMTKDRGGPGLVTSHSICHKIKNKIGKLANWLVYGKTTLCKNKLGHKSTPAKYIVKFQNFTEMPVKLLLLSLFKISKLKSLLVRKICEKRFFLLLYKFTFSGLKIIK